MRQNEKQHFFPIYQIWGKSAAFHFGVKIFWCQHTLRVLILLFQKPTKFLKLCSFTVLLSRELVLGMVCTHQFMYLSIFSPRRGCGIQWGIKTKFKTVLSNSPPIFISKQWCPKSIGWVNEFVFGLPEKLYFPNIILRCSLVGLNVLVVSTLGVRTYC